MHYFSVHFDGFVTLFLLLSVAAPDIPWARLKTDIYIKWQKIVIMIYLSHTEKEMKEIIIILEVPIVLFLYFRMTKEMLETF